MQRAYVREQYQDRDNEPKRRRDCAKNTQHGPKSRRLRRLSRVTVMRRHSVAIAFLIDASETRLEAAFRFQAVTATPTTSFSSGRAWRGACASKRRDGRDRLLQAMVVVHTYRTRTLPPRPWPTTRPPHDAAAANVLAPDSTAA